MLQELDQTREMVARLKTQISHAIPYDSLARRVYSVQIEQYAAAYKSSSPRRVLLTLRNRALADLERIVSSSTQAKERPTALNVYEDWTSGSKGVAKSVLRSAISFQREMLRLRYVLNSMGKTNGCCAPRIIVNISKYSKNPGTYHRDATDITIHLFKIPIKDEISGRILAKILEGYDQQFALCGTASSLYHFSTLTKGSCLRPAFILSSGEYTPANVARKLAKSTQLNVHSLYVMSEFGLLGFQCTECNHYHLLDSDFNFRNIGNGRLLVTDTTNLLTPYINYDTGDVCEIEDALGSDCSHGWPRVKRFRGRPYGKAYFPV